MVDVKETEMWLKSVFNINRELDFQRMVVSDALQRIEHLEKVLAAYTEKYNKLEQKLYKSCTKKPLKKYCKSMVTFVTP